MTAANNENALAEQAWAMTQTLLAIVRTRLQLAALDEEAYLHENLHIVQHQLLGWGLLLMGLQWTTLLLVSVYWASDLVMVMALLSAGFLLAALACWRFSVVKARQQTPLFSHTLVELMKDLETLQVLRETP